MYANEPWLPQQQRPPLINREIFIPNRKIGRCSLLYKKSGDLQPNRVTWKLCLLAWELWRGCLRIGWEVKKDGAVGWQVIMNDYDGIRLGMARCSDGPLVHLTHWHWSENPV